MKDNSLATLMMVTYNRLDLTKKTFETTLSNTGCSYNLIIIDNNSEDDTVNWLNQNCKNEYIQNLLICRLKENKGICYGRNMGLKLYDENFNTPYLCTLDNDVICNRNWLLNSCDLLNFNKTFGACGVNFEDKNFPIAKIKTGNYTQNIQIKPVGNLGTACQVFRKEIHEKLGFFNSMYSIYAHEDADIGFRIRMLKKNLCYLEENGIHLGVGDQDTGKYREMKDKYWKINMPIFEKNVRLYSNGLKSLYCKFEDYDPNIEY
jgi:GT2 family glycosyltransferase